MAKKNKLGIRETTCYKCGVKAKPAKAMMEGIRLDCLRCPKCGEEYFTSGEMIRYDILKGRRKLVRKFGTLGDSTITRWPPKLIKDYNIKPGDFALFVERPDGILIKPVSSKELEMK
ncbi:AbrB/MazE/SpoVT family DNA-binding domain-containing protein [Candidatus Woesearchaeota archaeon]|nr:AbrB/MazE/SpoVT family DNA-binding domain-containing protein [Candidatus Woesearchaeota archaeon]